MMTSADYRNKKNNLISQRDSFIQSVDECISKLNSALSSSSTAASSISGTFDTVLKSGLIPRTEELHTIISSAISELEGKKASALQSINEEIKQLSDLESAALLNEKEDE